VWSRVCGVARGIPRNPDTFTGCHTFLKGHLLKGVNYMKYTTPTNLEYKRLVSMVRYDSVDGVFYWVKTTHNTPSAGNGKAIPGRRVTHARGERADVVYGKHRIINFNCFRFNLNKLAFFCMLGRPPKGRVTHLNGVANDYRWENIVDKEGRAVLSLGLDEQALGGLPKDIDHSGPVLVGGTWVTG